MVLWVLGQGFLVGVWTASSLSDGTSIPTLSSSRPPASLVGVFLLLLNDDKDFQCSCPTARFSVLALSCSLLAFWHSIASAVWHLIINGRIWGLLLHWRGYPCSQSKLENGEKFGKKWFVLLQWWVFALHSIKYGRLTHTITLCWCCDIPSPWTGNVGRRMFPYIRTSHRMSPWSYESVQEIWSRKKNGIGVEKVSTRVMWIGILPSLRLRKGLKVHLKSYCAFSDVDGDILTLFVTTQGGHSSGGHGGQCWFLWSLLGKLGCYKWDILYSHGTSYGTSYTSYLLACSKVIMVVELQT